jgi:hypothetical protein
MSKKLRLIYLCLALAFVMVLISAARPTFSASAAQAPQPSNSYLQALSADPSQCYLSASDLQSLHVLYMPDQNIRLLETATGPVGFEGGFSALSRCR